MAGVKGQSGRPEGNPGNKGGKPYSQKNRNKAATLKGLVMDWATRVMKSKSKTKEMLKKKELVVSKILPTCVPRPIEVSGEDGQPIILKFDSSFNKNATP